MSRWNVSWSLALGMTLLMAACSGPREQADTGPAEPVDEVEPIRMADYEDFDPAQYEDAPPTQAAIEHDVPDRLLSGQADAPATRTVQGYRIQIFSSQDKAVADQTLENAVAWWQSLARNGELNDVYQQPLSPAPVYLIYRQPYYRVRLGDFATRDDAQRLLQHAEQRFGSAFIVPDRVTIHE